MPALMSAAEAAPAPAAAAAPRTSAASGTSTDTRCSHYTNFSASMATWQYALPIPSRSVTTCLQLPVSRAVTTPSPASPPAALRTVLSSPAPRPTPAASNHRPYITPQAHPSSLSVLIKPCSEHLSAHTVNMKHQLPDATLQRLHGAAGKTPRRKLKPSPPCTPSSPAAAVTAVQPRHRYQHNDSQAARHSEEGGASAAAAAACGTRLQQGRTTAAGAGAGAMSRPPRISKSSSGPGPQPDPSPSDPHLQRSVSSVSTVSLSSEGSGAPEPRRADGCPTQPHAGYLQEPTSPPAAHSLLPRAPPPQPHARLLLHLAAAGSRHCGGAMAMPEAADQRAHQSCGRVKPGMQLGLQVLALQVQQLGNTAAHPPLDVGWSGATCEGRSATSPVALTLPAHPASCAPLQGPSSPGQGGWHTWHADGLAPAYPAATSAAPRGSYAAAAMQLSRMSDQAAQHYQADAPPAGLAQGQLEPRAAGADWHGAGAPAACSSLPPQPQRFLTQSHWDRQGPGMDSGLPSRLGLGLPRGCLGHPKQGLAGLGLDLGLRLSQQGYEFGCQRLPVAAAAAGPEAQRQHVHDDGPGTRPLQQRLSTGSTSSQLPSSFQAASEQLPSSSGAEQAGAVHAWAEPVREPEPCAAAAGRVCGPRSRRQRGARSMAELQRLVRAMGIVAAGWSRDGLDEGEEQRGRSVDPKRQRGPGPGAEEQGEAKRWRGPGVWKGSGEDALQGQPQGAGRGSGKEGSLRSEDHSGMAAAEQLLEGPAPVPLPHGAARAARAGARWLSGGGSPEALQAAPVGDVCALRLWVGPDRSSSSRPKSGEGAGAGLRGPEPMTAPKNRRKAAPCRAAY